MFSASHTLLKSKFVTNKLNENNDKNMTWCRGERERDTRGDTPSPPHHTRGWMGVGKEEGRRGRTGPRKREKRRKKKGEGV